MAAVTVKHSTVVVVPDDGVSPVGSDEWNAGHVIAGLENVDNTSDVNKPISTATATALALLAPLASPALTGTPSAPTATIGTNTTQLATTAFVLANATGSVSPATVAPLIDGTAAVGTSLLYARQDHVHPTDTTRAALASPTFTGTPAAPTATVGTNTTQVATTAFVLANAASSGVSSIAAQTGAITLGNALKNVATEIDVDPGFLGETCFGGRLTALSATPVPNVDVVGSQNIYYAPFRSKALPVYSAAGGWLLKQFTSSSTDQVGLTLALAGSANWAADTLHDVFAVVDSGTLKLATRQWDAAMLWTDTLITPATIAASGGAAGYITTGTTPNAWTNPGNAFNGTTSQLAAVTAITSSPNGNSTNTTPGTINSYLGQDWGSGVTKTISKVVLYAPSDAWFCGQNLTAFSISVQGSNDGANWHLITIWRFNDTGAAGNVLTIPISVSEQLPCRYHRVGFDGVSTGNNRCAQVQFYQKTAPSAGRRLTLHDGIWVNDAIIGSGASPNNPMRTGAASTITTAQYEGIYLGMIHIDSGAAGQVTQHFLDGPSRVHGISNAYNQIPIKLSAFSYAPVTSYTPVGTLLWNQIESAVTGGGGITIQLVQGLIREKIRADLRRNVALNCTTFAASYEAGIGVDTALNFSGMEGTCNIDSTGQVVGFMPPGMCMVPSVAGVRNLFGIERQGNNGAGGQQVSTGPRNSHFSAEFMA